MKRSDNKIRARQGEGDAGRRKEYSKRQKQNSQEKEASSKMGLWLTAHLKWITSKDLLYSAGNSAQSYMAVLIGGEFAGEWIQFSSV